MEKVVINAVFTEDMIKKINKVRRENKDKWVCIEANSNFYQYQIKLYNTWVQLITKVDNATKDVLWRDGSAMDMNVKQFNNFLNKTLA